MALVPLIYTALALIATLSDAESANVNMDPASKQKDEIVDLRTGPITVDQGNSILIVHIK